MYIQFLSTGLLAYSFLHTYDPDHLSFLVLSLSSCVVYYSISTVLENMSCQGSTVGGRFEELRGIIDHVEDKSRIGVCLDTCHAFAAGHNLSEKTGLQRMLDEFSEIVGLSYLKAVHLNDSKALILKIIPMRLIFCILSVSKEDGSDLIKV
ncbi:hypothetical protein GDO78_009573 [Eleutherodactylus coqui]|uniref:Xylose isomerase-like TIM barrel domain-containing protein n=1 Tax=Eleutherodactylus coqui TaxID=57060 RepID=A0A8J6K9M1_ELECQ|nr:hypothetical protein GDO78_009573 [Eleutherodactylus coqui]